MSKPFKERVQKFWEAFSKEEAEVRMMMDNKVDGNILIKFVSNILNLAFEDPFFEMGINDEGKYELIMSPSGNRAILLELHYWLQRAPENLWEKWNFYSAKPGHPDSDFSMEMYDISISKEDVTIFYEVDEERPKINIEIYSPKLMELEENDRYNMFFIFLDQFIGELYTMEYIGYIDFVETQQLKNTVSLSHLKELIKNTIENKEWSRNDNPYESYTAYQREATEEENWSLREDIYIGYTASTAILNSFYRKEDDLFNDFEQNGVILGYLFYENINVPQKEIVSVRAEIEDKILAITEPHGIANSMGGATGFHFSYIDFIIFDYDAFLKIAKEVLSVYKFEEIGFAYYVSGSEPIWFNN